MRLEPLRNQIVVRLLPEPKQASGLVVPVHLMERPSAHAEVVSAGPEAWDVRAGDRVIVSRLQGLKIDLGEELLLLPESAVLAHL